MLARRIRVSQGRKASQRRLSGLPQARTEARIPQGGQSLRGRNANEATRWQQSPAGTGTWAVNGSIFLSHRNGPTTLSWGENGLPPGLSPVHCLSGRLRWSCFPVLFSPFSSPPRSFAAWEKARGDSERKAFPRALQPS